MSRPVADMKSWITGAINLSYVVDFPPPGSQADIRKVFSVDLNAPFWRSIAVWPTYGSYHRQEWRTSPGLQNNLCLAQIDPKSPLHHHLKYYPSCMQFYKPSCICRERLPRIIFLWSWFIYTLHFVLAQWWLHCTIRFSIDDNVDILYKIHQTCLFCLSILEDIYFGIRDKFLSGVSQEHKQNVWKICVCLNAPVSYQFC